MQNNSLSNIRFDSIKSIFNCISLSKNISRAEISEKTHLSVVTVGKIVDALSDLDVVTQSKSTRASAGRRASVVNVNKSSFIIIFDLTSYKFHSTVLDLSLNLIETFDGKYETLSSYPDNLTSFINQTKSYVNKKYGMNNCIGIGVSVPGIYDSENDSAHSPRIPEIVVLPIRSFFEKYFSDITVYTESSSNAAGRANILSINGYDSKDIIYWHISEENVCGAHFINGELIGGRGGFACDFGRMILDIDLTLEERMALCKSERDCANLMSPVLYNMIRVLSPHAFIMEYDMHFPTECLNNMIFDDLIQRYKLPKNHIPSFHPATCKFKNSYYGLALELREIWLRKKVFLGNS